MIRRVLALDGGGVRGLAAARFLEYVERRLGRPLTDVVDLFAGTSTGAIMAVAMGVKGMSGAQISGLYTGDNMRAIMDETAWDRMLGLVQPTPKYDGQGKRQTLERYFGKTTLGQAVKPTIVVTYDVERRSSLVLKSTKPEHHALLASVAADASSAAPLYFPTVHAQVPGSSGWLIDGGVIVNNPALCAYAEAKKLWPHDELRLLSIGTGQRTRKIPGKASRGWGAVGWITHDLLGVVMDESMVDYQARMLLGPERYLRVNAELTRATGVNDDMDDTTRGNLAALEELGVAWSKEYGGQALRLLADEAPARA